MIKNLETYKISQYINDVIVLDVQRSLSIHRDNVSQEILTTLLRAFSAYLP